MIKKLTILGLLLLVLPFFQTCSDKSLMENSYLKSSILAEEVQPTELETKSGEISVESKNQKEFHYTFQELKEKKQKTIKGFLAQKNEMTHNGYELGYLFIKQIDITDLKNTFDFTLLPFFLTIIIGVLLVIFSFAKKWKIIIILTILNLLLLVVHLIVAYKSKSLEDIEQIKFGYYLFILNLILIIVETDKVQKKKKRTHNSGLAQLVF
jgi:hypothetical protein